MKPVTVKNLGVLFEKGCRFNRYLRPLSWGMEEFRLKPVAFRALKRGPFKRFHLGCTTHFNSKRTVFRG
jgi:hypothetical protein